jgi:hypothetical protein
MATPGQSFVCDRYAGTPTHAPAVKAAAGLVASFAASVFAENIVTGLSELNLT